MRKKVTQETANQLRELLEKVISEREDAVPLPKDHQIARILWPVFALCFAGVYLQNTYIFFLIRDAIEYSSQLGVWKTFEFLVVTLSLRFWTWSVPFIVLGAVFFWRRHSFKKEFNALVERAKEEITLGKKTTRDKSHPCKRTRRLFKNIANGISI